MLLHFEEVPLVHHPLNDLLDVVGQVGFVRHDAVQFRVSAVRRIGGGSPGRVLEVVGRQEAEQLADQREALGVVAGDEVSHAADSVVGRWTAQFLFGHLLVCHRADHLGSGYEHGAGVLHHHDEVGDGRRIDGAAGTRAQNRRNLGITPLARVLRKKMSA